MYLERYQRLKTSPSASYALDCRASPAAKAFVLMREARETSAGDLEENCLR